MGWDCTLHVVDDTSLARFAARFLRGLHRGTAFDREFDGDDLIAKVKQLIADDPSTGARALAELALLYVSTETPHLYCRGFALSLWDPAVMGAVLPAQLLTSVETRIPDVISAYPNIAGHLPARFDGAFCVGPFVTARNVPALLELVEPVVGAMPPREAVTYRPLVEILRVAAARNLAYWEGTDLDVTLARPEWLPQRPSPVVKLPNPFTSPLARPCAIDGTRMLVADHVALHELDTRTFPPSVVTHEDTQVNAAAFTPWGTTFVRMATDRTVRPFKFSYVELPDRTPLAIEPPFAIGLARPGRDCLILFPQATTTERTNIRPLVMRADHRLESLLVPDPVETQRVECDAIAFGDGELLVVWDAVAYRWDGVGAPVMLGETLDAPDDLAAVALSDGSIVGGFGHKLLRVARTGTSTPVLPLDNVTSLARGPNDVLIIGEGENPEGDAYKLWWPATREVTHIPPSVLELDERPMFAYYDPIEDLLVAARPGAWHAIPWSELAALRREG
ncbi:MAG: hypothetical protein ABI591_04875 [Kofleriaceae bacterium]